MKNILFVLIALTLFSCASSPTEKLVKDLEQKFSGFEDKSEGFYMKTVKAEKGLMSTDIKGIIDRDLNATPTKKNEGWFFEGSLVDSYEWDLPKVHVKLESSFKESQITHKIWVTNK